MSTQPKPRGRGHATFDATTRPDGRPRATSHFKANPAIAKRYADDVAFHDGFDALCWSKNDKAAPAGANAAPIHDLESRDARYAAAHVTLRM